MNHPHPTCQVATNCSTNLVLCMGEQCVTDTLLTYTLLTVHSWAASDTVILHVFYIFMHYLFRRSYIIRAHRRHDVAVDGSTKFRDCNLYGIDPFHSKFDAFCRKFLLCHIQQQCELLKVPA